MEDKIKNVYIACSSLVVGKRDIFYAVKFNFNSSNLFLFVSLVAEKNVQKWKLGLCVSTHIK